MPRQLKAIGPKAAEIQRFLRGERLLRQALEGWPNPTEWSIPTEITAKYAAQLIRDSARVYCAETSAIPAQEGLDRPKVRLMAREWRLAVDDTRNILVIGPRSALKHWTPKTDQPVGYQMTRMGAPAEAKDLDINLRGDREDLLDAAGLLLQEKVFHPDTKFLIDSVPTTVQSALTIKYPNVEFIEHEGRIVMC